MLYANLFNQVLSYLHGFRLTSSILSLTVALTLAEGSKVNRNYHPLASFSHTILNNSFFFFFRNANLPFKSDRIVNLLIAVTVTEEEEEEWIRMKIYVVLMQFNLNMLILLNSKIYIVCIHGEKLQFC